MLSSVGQNNNVQRFSAVNALRSSATQLNKATEEYEKGTPIMSDMEWDNMYFTLVNLEKESGYEHPESPTKIIYPKIVSLCISF